MLTNTEGEVLLARRSEFVHRGGTWAFPGGAVEPGETAAACALREAEEELGLDPDSVAVTQTVPGVDHGSWHYTYVLGTLSAPKPRLQLNWESDAIVWLTPDKVGDLRLHPDLRTAWPVMRDLW